jgi:nicotine blue oxidoreductase
VTGLLLAAGAGRRFGGPKALVVTDGVPWVARAAQTLSDGGCDQVFVVAGRWSAAVRPLLPPTVAVVSGDSAQLSDSLRLGLTALPADADAALVHLVDLPDVGPAAVARVRAGATPDTLARAAYRDRPGHPVVLGRRWWPAVTAAARGDCGARSFLHGNPNVRLVDCTDLATGADVDTKQSNGLWSFGLDPHFRRRSDRKGASKTNVPLRRFR